jgi:hypothetical protein
VNTYPEFERRAQGVYRWNTVTTENGAVPALNNAVGGVLRDFVDVPRSPALPTNPDDEEILITVVSRRGDARLVRDTADGTLYTLTPFEF